MSKIKLIIIGIFVLILVGIFFYFEATYSDGYRAGTLIKFSKKGYLFKTYEGELNLGMVLNDDPNRSPTSVGSLWQFSVSSSADSVIHKIDDALLTGKRIKLHYQEKYTTAFWRGDSRYLIDDAEIVK